MLRCAISGLAEASVQRHPDGESILFSLFTQTGGEEEPVLRQLKAVIRPDDAGKPLITLSLPAEASHD
jgi:hypothetical protein